MASGWCEWNVNKPGGVELQTFLGEWRDTLGHDVIVDWAKPGHRGGQLSVQLMRPQGKRDPIRLDIKQFKQRFTCGHYDLNLERSNAGRIVWEDMRNRGKSSVWERKDQNQEWDQRDDHWGRERQEVQERQSDGDRFPQERQGNQRFRQERQTYGERAPQDRPSFGESDGRRDSTPSPMHHRPPQPNRWQLAAASTPPPPVPAPAPVQCGTSEDTSVPIPKGPSAPQFPPPMPMGAAAPQGNWNNSCTPGAWVPPVGPPPVTSGFPCTESGPRLGTSAFPRAQQDLNDYDQRLLGSSSGPKDAIDQELDELLAAPTSKELRAQGAQRGPGAPCRIVGEAHNRSNAHASDRRSPSCSSSSSPPPRDGPQLHGTLHSGGCLDHSGHMPPSGFVAPPHMVPPPHFHGEQIAGIFRQDSPGLLASPNAPLARDEDDTGAVPRDPRQRPRRDSPGKAVKSPPRQVCQAVQNGPSCQWGFSGPVPMGMSFPAGYQYPVGAPGWPMPPPGQFVHQVAPPSQVSASHPWAAMPGMSYGWQPQAEPSQRHDPRSAISQEAKVSTNPEEDTKRKLKSYEALLLGEDEKQDPPRGSESDGGDGNVPWKHKRRKVYDGSPAGV